MTRDTGRQRQTTRHREKHRKAETEIRRQRQRGYGSSAVFGQRDCFFKAEEDQGGSDAAMEKEGFAENVGQLGLAQVLQQEVV